MSITGVPEQERIPRSEWYEEQQDRKPATNVSKAEEEKRNPIAGVPSIEGRDIEFVDHTELQQKLLQST
jgi:hypothetical protein